MLSKFYPIKCSQQPGGICIPNIVDINDNEEIEAQRLITFPRVSTGLSLFPKAFLT